MPPPLLYPVSDSALWYGILYLWVDPRKGIYFYNWISSGNIRRLASLYWEFEVGLPYKAPIKLFVNRMDNSQWDYRLSQWFSRLLGIITEVILIPFLIKDTICVYQTSMFLLLHHFARYFEIQRLEQNNILLFVTLNQAILFHHQQIAWF